MSERETEGEEERKQTVVCIYYGGSKKYQHRPHIMDRERDIQREGERDRERETETAVP